MISRDPREAHQLGEVEEEEAEEEGNEASDFAVSRGAKTIPKDGQLRLL